MINIKKVNNKYKEYAKIRGVIHIGAHMMQERNAYLRCGLDNTIWIEGNKNIYEKICKLVKNTNERVFSYVVSDKDDEEVDFNITTNNGQSSSILKLGQRHLIEHPNVLVSKTVKTKTRRMSTIIKSNNIQIENYNFLTLDVQGAELLVLKGFGNLLNKFDFICSEVNADYLYKDCALIGEIDDYLLSFGFQRKETEMTRHKWGDALYVKQNLLS